MTQLSSDALLQLSKKEKNANKRMRLLAVSMFIESQNRAYVARQLKVARRSVNHWVSEYLSKGIVGLDDKPRKGRESLLSSQQQKQLARYIDKQATSDKGGRLTGMDIRQYIIVHFGVEYHLSHVYKLLKSLGFSWITSRSKHPKQSQSAQDAYKKVPSGNDPSHPGSRVPGAD